MSSSGNDPDILKQAVAICTWVVYGVVCQTVNIFGIITNIINIVCFVKQGFKESVNVNLLGLAVSDLGSLTTMVWSCICYTPIMMTAKLPFDPFEVMYLTTGLTHFSFTRVSSCLTAMITIERCLCITAPLKIKSIITPKRSAVITICVFVVIFFIGTPVYSVNRLDLKFHPLRNRTLIGLVSSKNREKVEMLSITINNFFIPFGAFVIIVVCTVILSIKLNSHTKWRNTTIANTKAVNVSTRNQKTAKMVLMISTLFIVCFVPVSIIIVVATFQQDMSLTGKYLNISILMGAFGYTLESINASMNICIYYQMSSNYRDIFYKLFYNKKCGSIL